MSLRTLVIVFSLALAGCATESGNADADVGREVGGDSDVDDAGGEDSGDVSSDPASDADAGADADSDSDATQDVDADVSGGQTTYWQHVYPVLQENCAGCHFEGGIGESRALLDSYDHARSYAPIGVWAMSEGIMPPWQAGDDCREYQLERHVTDDEIAVVQAWIDDGFPEGNPDARVEPSMPSDPRESYGAPDVDQSIGGAFSPPEGLLDWHQCFALDYEFSETAYLELTDFVADDLSIVHHALVYAVGPETVPQMEALVSADPDLGYECFGGPGLNGTQLIAAWVPGFVPLTLPEDSAFVVEAGSRIVVEVHYNTASNPDGEDESRLQLWFEDTAPEWSVRMRAFRDGNLNIPAYEPYWVEETEFVNDTDEAWNIVGAAPHMHLLGVETSLVVNEAGGEESCLIDIPDWDFDWQQMYRFVEGDVAVVEPGESVVLRCAYDNSEAHQPVVNGEQIAPRDVQWGDGTFDEMCITYAMFLEPTGQGGTGICEGFNTCFAQCSGSVGSPSGCAWYCSNLEGGECQACYDTEMVPCIEEGCASEAAAFDACVDTCGGEVACVRDNCTDEAVAMDDCVVPYVGGGACAAATSTCEISFSR